MKRPTQYERVLKLLQQEGRRGITQVDFLAPHVADGGPPITRVAAAIKKLRNEGHPIERRGWRDKCAVYVLAPPGSRAAAAIAHDTPDGCPPEPAEAPQRPAGPVVSRDGPWDYRYLCAECAYRKTAGPECERCGAEAVLCWHLDVPAWHAAHATGQAGGLDAGAAAALDEAQAAHRHQKVQAALS